MDSISMIAMVSIVTAGVTIAIGSLGPAFGEARAVAQALGAIAQQPDAAGTITRTLFVGARDDRVNRDLLSRNRADPAVREPVLDSNAGARWRLTCKSTG